MKVLLNAAALTALFGISALAGQAVTDYAAVAQYTSGATLIVDGGTPGPSINGDAFIGTVWQGQSFSESDLETYLFYPGILSIGSGAFDGTLICSGSTDLANAYLEEVLTYSCYLDSLAQQGDTLYEASGEAITALTGFEQEMAEAFWAAIIWHYGSLQPEDAIDSVPGAADLLAFYRGYFAATDDFPGEATSEMVLGMLELYKAYKDAQAEAAETAADITWILLEAPEGIELKRKNSDEAYFKGSVAEPGTYEIKIEATRGEVSARRTLTLEVLPTALALSTYNDTYTVDLGEPLQGVFFLSGRTNSDGFYFYLAYEGELPEGVGLDFWEVDEFGQKFIFLHGVPTQVGEFPVALIAENRGSSERLEFSIVVTVPVLAEESDTVAEETPDPESPPAEEAEEAETPVTVPVTIPATDSDPADPSEGTDTENTSENEVESELSLAEIAFGPDYVEFTRGFSYSPWMGFNFVGNMPWVYNFELGWLYVLEETESDEAVWLYHTGNPSLGWMFGGSGLDGFFYYELEPGVFGWNWLYTGVVDFDTPEDPPANP